jgi:hypothetical protein
MKVDVDMYVSNSMDCERVKASHKRRVRLMQSLRISSMAVHGMTLTCLLLLSYLVHEEGRTQF